MPNGQTVRSVSKAMELLDILLRRRTPMSLSELAEGAGYPKSTTHALLTTLRDCSMVEQKPDGRYYLGIRLFECGCAVSSQWDISTTSRSFLEHLANTTGACAFISVMEGASVITFDQCVGNTGMRVVSEIGCRLPLHATSQGKLLLSGFPDGEVLRRMNAAPLEAFTPHTIVDPRRLVELMSQIRADGYAVEDGEFKIGLRSVSAPVYDRTGAMRYALGVVGFFRRVRSEGFEAAVREVTESAAGLSQAIGYRPGLAGQVREYP